MFDFVDSHKKELQLTKLWCVHTFLAQVLHHTFFLRYGLLGTWPTGIHVPLLSLKIANVYSTNNMSLQNIFKPVISTMLIYQLEVSVVVVW